MDDFLFWKFVSFPDSSMKFAVAKDLFCPYFAGEEVPLMLLVLCSLGADFRHGFLV